VPPQQLSTWRSDVHGDCVTAEEVVAKACSQPEIVISDREAIDWATRQGILPNAYLQAWRSNENHLRNERRICSYSRA
jgi:hypothetical protein